jgi:hypothetical protein
MGDWQRRVQRESHAPLAHGDSAALRFLLSDRQE